MLRYRIEKINNIRVIVLEGQLSVTEREILKSIQQKEKEEDERSYILDLSHVFYIDSFGIGFLQNLVLGKDRRKSMIIVSDKDYIDYVIRFNKIDKLLDMRFVRTLDDAIDKYEESLN